MNQEGKVLLSGNEAAAEGAIRAGCRFYAGYPITPQNELIAYMADQLPLRGGVFLQAESELAAISMLYGASAAGVRCMTSSGSPGVSLKQEGISYMAGCELPAVIVNVSRGGPGLGNIGPSQADYFQATRGGGHGDYRTLCLAPSTAQEMGEFAYLAFDLADRYRNPVLILSDAVVGQMMEPVTFDALPPPDPPAKPWALTGAEGRPRNIVRSLLLGKGRLEEHNVKLQQKYREMAQAETRCEKVACEGADILLVAHGSCARIASEVVARPPAGLRDKIGLLRPITVWPFPHDELREAAKGARGVLTVEMSAGQLVEDVQLAVQGRCPVHLLSRMGGGFPSAGEIAEKIISVFG